MKATYTRPADTGCHYNTCYNLYVSVYQSVWTIACLLKVKAKKTFTVSSVPFLCYFKTIFRLTDIFPSKDTSVITHHPVTQRAHIMCHEWWSAHSHWDSATCWSEVVNDFRWKCFTEIITSEYFTQRNWCVFSQTSGMSLGDETNPSFIICRVLEAPQTLLGKQVNQFKGSY